MEKERLEFEKEQEIERFITQYLEEKAEEIKPFDPFNYFRLNEISYELKKIFEIS